MSIVPTPESDRARFWAKVDKETIERVAGLGPCWIWIGAIHTNGYGAFLLHGKQRQAHIVSYEWFFGPVPLGLKVLHDCDVKACVNPAHLHAGTHKRNMEEMVERGRAAAGVRSGMHVHGLTKLSDVDIREVFALYEGGMFQHEIAAQKNIEQSMVSMILRGKRWAHLLPDEFVPPPPAKPRPSDDTIREVRRLALEGKSQSQIGATVGMSQPAVSRIVNRVAYAEIDD